MSTENSVNIVFVIKVQWFKLIYKLIYYLHVNIQLNNFL